MEFGGKKFEFYWKIIQGPLYVLVGWNLIGFIVACFSYQTYMNIFSSLSGLVLSILIFGFIGWTAIKDYQGEIKHGAWSGALTGVISGLIGAVLSIGMFYLVPEMMQQSLTLAVQKGAPAETVKTFMQIGIFFNLLLAPLISGVIGALISVIASLIAQTVKNKK